MQIISAQILDVVDDQMRVLASELADQINEDGSLPEKAREVVETQEHVKLVCNLRPRICLAATFQVNAMSQSVRDAIETNMADVVAMDSNLDENRCGVGFGNGYSHQCRTKTKM